MIRKWLKPVTSVALATLASAAMTAMSAASSPRTSGLIVQDVHLGFGLLAVDDRRVVPFVEPLQSAVEIAWAPDGRSVAFSKPFRSGERLFLQIGSASPRRLLDAPAAPLLQPVWSPKLNSLAVARRIGKGSVTRIFIVEVAAKGRIRQSSRSPDASASDFSPTWSLDGGRIAFLRQTATESLLMIQPATGGGAARVVLRERREGTASKPAAGFTRVSWSPDGTRLAFADAAGIHVLDATSGDANLVVSAPSAFNPVWSPDSRRLAWIERATEAGQTITRGFILDLEHKLRERLPTGVVPFQWLRACKCTSLLKG